jgi:hypothetical protein
LLSLCDSSVHFVIGGDETVVGINGSSFRHGRAFKSESDGRLIGPREIINVITSTCAAIRILRRRQQDFFKPSIISVIRENSGIPAI